MLFPALRVGGKKPVRSRPAKPLSVTGCLLHASWASDLLWPYLLIARASKTLLKR